MYYTIYYTILYYIFVTIKKIVIISIETIPNDIKKEGFGVAKTLDTKPLHFVTRNT